MGVLAPGSARARPSARPPINLSGNISAHVSASHLRTSPPTPQKSYLEFRNPRTNFEIFTKKIKKPKNAPQGARGGLRIFLGVNISFFLVRINPL